MSEKAKNKGRLGGIASVLCFGIIGLGCGISMVPFMIYALEEEGNMFIFLLGVLILFSLMYLSIFIEMAIHEARHRVCGIATGYKFLSYRIGSFTFIKEEGRIKVKRYVLPGTGGQCLMSPPPYSSSMPYVLYNAGGAILNFLSSLLFLLLFFLFYPVPFLSSFLLMSAFVSFGLGAMNIIPLIYGNDGSNILNIGRSKKEKESFWAQMKLVEYQSRGIRLKDMPEEIFPVKAKDEIEGIMSASAFVFYENKLIDEGDYEGALEKAEEALSSPLLPQILRVTVKCDVIYLLLILEKDKKEVDAIKDKTLIKQLKAMRGLITVMRSEYSYALLYEKNEDKAAEIRKAFDSTSEKYPYAYEIESERYLMDKALSLYLEDSAIGKI